VQDRHKKGYIAKKQRVKKRPLKKRGDEGVKSMGGGQKKKGGKKSSIG